MHLTLSENLLWALGIGLKILLCTLVVYRKTYHRLPFFSIYAVLLVAEAGVVWYAYREWGYLSTPAWYAYWVASLLVLLARALVVVELCSTSLRGYPAIWSLARKVLGVLAVLVFGYAVMTTYRASLASFVLNAERGLELSFVVILVALLGFGARYRVPLGPVHRNIAIGLYLYSCFQVINNTFMNDWMIKYFHWWVSMRVVAFDAALIVWIVPLSKAVQPPPEPPVVISEQVAARLLRAMLATMRELTNELKRISKSKWK